MDADVIAQFGIDARIAGDMRVLVLTGYGLNCEAETAAGFRMLGANVELVHVGDLIERGASGLVGRHLLAFVGGFSFGDHVSSGRILANRLRYHMGDALQRFVDDGGLVLGICNGFQTLVKLGLLPALDRRPGAGLASQMVSLVRNDRVGYRDAWVTLGADPASPCVFTHGITTLELPSRHGEGKLVFRDETCQRRCFAQHLVALRYLDANGDATEAWPDNPNGSPGGAAALCDTTGRVFGIMPHPDAHLYRENHPDWPHWPDDTSMRDHGLRVQGGQGLAVFANGIRAASFGAAPALRHH